MAWRFCLLLAGCDSPVLFWEALKVAKEALMVSISKEHHLLGDRSNHQPQNSPANH